MTRLFMMLLTIALGTGAGIGVIVALSMGYYAIQPILVGAAIGAVLSVPVAWFVARKLEEVEMEDEG